MCDNVGYEVGQNHVNPINKRMNKQLCRNVNKEASELTRLIVKRGASH